MNPQPLIFLGLAVLLAINIVVYGRQQRKLVALRDLIASSPAVCFVCCREKGKYIHRKTAVPDHIHPDYHEYIDAHLVYMPDELLR